MLSSFTKTSDILKSLINSSKNIENTIVLLYTFHENQGTISLNFHENQGIISLNLHEIKGKYMLIFHEIEDIVTVLDSAKLFLRNQQKLEDYFQVGCKLTKVGRQTAEVCKHN